VLGRPHASHAAREKGERRALRFSAEKAGVISLWRWTYQIWCCW